ncbi:MAG: lamin tail domain-containing protein [Candidatus Spechtbacterales bacterium]|nr:lamin tail domain-containing protein [Candidatus Spechtbacterales bacterium]
MIIFLAVVIAGFLYLWNEAYGAEAKSIIINEVAWMGDTAEEDSHYNEWIEFYNNTDSPIALDGWILKAADDTPIIELSGTIDAGSYYIAARNNETSTIISKADLIYGSRYYKHALKNNPEGEDLKLINAEGNIIDEINAPGGWPAGNNETKETMSLVDNAWVNGPTGGTPGEPNYTQETSPEPTPEPEPEPEPNETSPENNAEPNEEVQQELEKEKTSKHLSEEEQLEITASEEEPDFIKTFDIVLSEFMPSPEGADSENEWIELLNTGNETIDISNWILDDMEGGSNPFIFPEGTNILPGEYRVFSADITDLALNNSGDNVRLLFPDKTISDEVEYSRADEGYSYALIENDWIWTNNATPGSENEKPDPVVSSKQQRVKKVATKVAPKKEDIPQEQENETITTEEFMAQTTNKTGGAGGLLPFTIGILVAAGGGAGFFFMRKKL